MAKGPCLKLRIGLDPQLDWSRSLYVSIPLWARPSPLNLVFKDLAGVGVQLEGQRVVFHLVDFDAY